MNLKSSLIHYLISCKECKLTSTAIIRRMSFVDFDRANLTGLSDRQISTEGPQMTKGDVNGDGMKILFGGSKDGQP